MQNNPEFIFGCLKESETTKKLISKLETTQSRIKKLLTSPLFSFLETILEAHRRKIPL